MKGVNACFSFVIGFVSTLLLVIITLDFLVFSLQMHLLILKRFLYRFETMLKPSSVVAHVLPILSAGRRIWTEQVSLHVMSFSGCGKFTIRPTSISMETWPKTRGIQKFSFHLMKHVLRVVFLLRPPRALTWQATCGMRVMSWHIFFVFMVRAPLLMMTLKDFLHQLMAVKSIPV